MVDVRHFTPLSFACYKNNEACFFLLFNHAMDNNMGDRKFQEKKEKMKQWINTPTDEDFISLHFATYHGNLELIKFLADNGADFTKKNKFGSTVLHVAS